MTAAIFRVVRAGSCMLRTRTVALLTTNNRASSTHPDVGIQEEKFPYWAQTPLDQMILKANSVQSLFKLFEKNSLSITQATNVVAALAKLSIQNQIDPGEILGNEKFRDLCTIIDSNIRNMNNYTLLSTLRSLLNMGIPPETFIVQSLETELLWKIRKLNLRLMVQVLSFHLPYQQTELQRKVVAEALEKIQQRWFEISDPREIVSLLKLCSHFHVDFINKLEDRTIELLDKMAVEDLQKILTVLAEQKLRPTHLLRALAFHMSKHPQKLSVRQMSNVVYALSSLNFPDVVLLRRISTDLLPEVANMDKSVASFLIAFGQLKWRHTALLEAFTEWFQRNFEQCRVHDLVSYILTLAHVNFLPMGSEVLFPMLLPRVTLESVRSEVIWINVVWALTVLQKATPDHFKSVLTPDFGQKLQDLHKYQAQAYQKKLLIINAAATLEMPDYKGLQVSKFNIQDSMPQLDKGDKTLKNSVVDTLSNYIPRGKYLSCDKRLFADVYVDAEFIVDKDCKPVPLEEYSQNINEKNKKFNPGTHRVALVVQDFKDFTLHNVTLTGHSSLVVHILKKMGYVVMQIPFTEYNCQASTVKRLQYLQQKIVDAINESKSKSVSNN